MHDPIGVTVSIPNNGPVTNATCEISPTLPTGITLTQGTCTISGTPTVTQSATTYTLWVNDSGVSDSTIVTITIDESVLDPPSILPASISVVLTNTTAMTPISFSNSGGAVDSWEVDPVLPDGLSLASGIISGTPTTVQTAADYTVWANNSDGAGSAIVTITVNEFVPDPSSISPASISVVLTNTTAMSPIEFTNSGGIIDTWEISPALSPGLTINSDNGTISGTPTTVENAIAYTVWANNTGGSDSAIVTITVEEMLPDPPEISYDSPVVLTQYQQMTTIVPTNTGGDVDTWEISPALSSGLTLSADGTISGIPITDENAITYTIWANNTGGSDSAVLVITVEVAPDGLSISSPNLTLVRDVTMQPWYFVYIGGEITSWEISPDLPPGLIFDFANNLIIGTPTEIMAATNFTIWANSSIITESIIVNIEVLEDTDGDGMPDDLGDRTNTGLIEDLDDDADGISDVAEGLANPITDSLLPDTDGDGVCDGSVNVTIRGVDICTGGPDHFPTDPAADTDTDGDGDPDEVRDGFATNLTEDLDDDNDGLSDENETAGFSITDSLLPDTDGDGVCDGSVNVTIRGEEICTGGPDAFPDDPTEWLNTDGTCTTECIADLIGNNADLDDDGDQASDLDEIAAGTDPLDPLDFPTDDTDGDGWTDANENLCGTDMLDNMSFPSDYDGDGWCDATDTDDDNDGWFDTDENDCGTDSLDEKDIPGDADGDGICDALEIKPEEEVDGGFPWWLCSLIFFALIIILPLIMRLIDDAMPVNTTMEPKAAGAGTRDDPFILTPIKGIEPGGKILSKETITIINMTSKLKVPIIDLNESDNGDRFKVVGEMLSDERVAMIIATKEGTMKFLMSFDDSSNPTLEGGTFESVLKVGTNSVYFNWDVTVKSDPDSAKKAKKAKAKKAAMAAEAAMASEVDDAEEKGKVVVIKEKIHSTLDRDGDGELTLGDVKTGAVQMGKTVKTGAVMVGKTVKTGAVQVGKTVKIGAVQVGKTVKKGTGKAKEKVVAAKDKTHEYLDKDGDGKLTKNDLKIATGRTDVKIAEAKAAKKVKTAEKKAKKEANAAVKAEKKAAKENEAKDAEEKEAKAQAKILEEADKKALEAAKAKDDVEIKAVEQEKAGLAKAAKAAEEMSADISRTKAERAAKAEKEAKDAAKAAKAAKAEMEAKDADKPVSKAEKKSSDLNRIKSNAENIDFATIGIASASDKDNLQELVGIGPFIEEKLNALGIYKFEQLSKMTSQIETDVNEAIEFFPGRVKRDEWKKQAQKLV
jgi:predicted flap endonuclease-1-like 5' DNA nuclease